MLFYLLGLLTLPVLALFTGIIAWSYSRTNVVERTCDSCAWSFRGLAKYRLWGQRPGPSERPRKLPLWLSTTWHEQIVMRTSKHRRAWTLNFRVSEPAVQARLLPFTRKFGERGVHHEVRPPGEGRASLK